MAHVCDTIGHEYRAYRRLDPRLAAAILEAWEGADRVVNVGAGSYEPADRAVVAMEPSTVMLRQRRSDVPVVQASATDLPFRDGAFAASLAVLTVHHWPDRARGLAELARVAGRRRRPSAYLDAGVRSAISTFAKLRAVDAGLAQLRTDLAEGTWRRRHGHRLDRSELDLGDRLVVGG